MAFIYSGDTAQVYRAAVGFELSNRQLLGGVAVEGLNVQYNCDYCFVGKRHWIKYRPVLSHFASRWL